MNQFVLLLFFFLKLEHPYWLKPRCFRLIFFVLTIIFVFNPKVLYDTIITGVRRTREYRRFFSKSHTSQRVYDVCVVCCEKGQKKKPLTVKLIPSTEPIAKHLSPTLQAPLNIWWQSIMWPWKCVHLRTGERAWVSVCLCVYAWMCVSAGACNRLERTCLEFLALLFEIELFSTICCWRCCYFLTSLLAVPFCFVVGFF